MEDDDEFEDLDGILDSALDEFDIGVADGNSAANIAPGAAVTVTTDDDPLTAALAPFDDDIFDRLPLIVQTGEDLEPERTPTPDANTGDIDGMRAFEDALKSLNTLDLNSGDSGDAGAGEHTEEEDMKLVEDFLKSLGSQLEGMSTPGAAARSSGSAGADTPLGGNMAREFESLIAGFGGDSGAASSDVASSSAAGDTGGGDGTGPAGGPEFEKIVENVVGELLSKDVLKGPMEQMRDAYAVWLPANADTVGETEAARFRKQEGIVKKICALYEREDCSPAAVMSLLQEMQDTGAPPTEVMKQLGDDGTDGSAGGNGDGAAAEMDKLAGCPVQ
jgi:Pex19 protein family